MPATVFITLLAEYGPTVVEKLSALWHNGGDLTNDEIIAHIADIMKTSADYKRTRQA